MPHFEQKKCFAVPMLNWYTLNASSPCSMVMPSSSADTATAPRMRQYEQLQRRAVHRPSVSLTVKRTVPQWQEALDSVMSGSIDTPSVRDRHILKAASLMWEPLQRRCPYRTIENRLGGIGGRFSGRLASLPNGRQIPSAPSTPMLASPPSAEARFTAARRASKRDSKRPMGWPATRTAHPRPSSG